MQTEVSPDERARLDELFADLLDQSGTVEPITAAERHARRQRLAALLADANLDALLSETGATMSYLAGVEWGLSERLFGLVVTAGGDVFWLAPGFEVERAQGIVADCGGEVIPWQEHQYPYEPLASALRERGVERLGVEPSLRHRFVHGISRELGEGSVGIAADTIVALRGRKDAHELELLRRANELTLDAIRAVAERIEPGATQRDIGAMLTVAQERLGLSGIWNLSLIGPSAAYPHGHDAGAGIEAGDVLLVDTGGKLHGYCSDNTRTWAFGGEPSERFAEIWHVVRSAQVAAFEAIRPGARCSEVDHAARSVIEAAGFGPGYRTFTHRLGHGIGIEGHEDPYFDGGSDVRLEPGMTFSNEPGIYIHGELGVRCEDIVAVTDDGADHFGTWQLSPESPR